MENTHTIYVKALSNEEWFGAWAPVKARLDEDDEYEFFETGSLLIAVWDGEVFKVAVGVSV